MIAVMWLVIRKERKDAGTARYDNPMDAAGVASLCLVALPVAFVIWLFVQPPPTEAELREREWAVEKANREYARECQELFDVWSAGMATDKQKEDLQGCVRDFGNL